MLEPGAWWALHAVLALSMLVLAPLGLRVVAEAKPALATVAGWWPWIAAPAAGSLLLPVGWFAALLCLPYALATLAAPVLGSRPTLGPPPLAAALVALPVAASGLVAERAGVDLFGFPPAVLALTVAHFHVAGFGALLLVSLLDGPRPGGHAARGAGWLAVGGVALVGVGFVIGRTGLGEAAGDAVELVGAGLLTAGLWLGLAVALADGAASRGRRAGVAALGGTAVVTMALALSWAAGHVFELAHPGLTWMVLTHGVLNAAAVLTAVLVVWLTRTEPGWRTGRMRHRLGHGIDRYEAAAEALFRWDMHRGAGAWVDSGTPDAVVGLKMVSRLGVGPGDGRWRLSEPCQVLVARRETFGDGAARAKLRYLALPGHVFQGEEEFRVLIEPDGAVWFEVSVTSRPSWWLARLAGPAAPIAQHLFIARCAHVLRRAPVLSGAVTA